MCFGLLSERLQSTMLQNKKKKELTLHARVRQLVLLKKNKLFVLHSLDKILIQRNNADDLNLVFILFPCRYKLLCSTMLYPLWTQNPRGVNSLISLSLCDKDLLLP